MLAFKLLGDAELYSDRELLTDFRSQKEAALLIFLAHTQQTHPRDTVAELLWDSKSAQQARSNLRTVISRLRKRLGEALVVTRKTVAIAPTALEQVDSTHLLEQLVDYKTVDSAERAHTLEQALITYHGEFLNDFSLAGASRFEAWQTTTREHIRRQVSTAYDKLARYYLKVNDLENGIIIVRRWLHIDALNDEAHELLIQMQLAVGQVSEASAQFDYAAELFKTELDIDFAADLRKLIQTARVKPAIPTPSVTAISPTSPYPPSTGVFRHNLPAVFDEFIGRKKTQQQIHDRLNQPWCRLITIVGQGGAGKTRLSTTIARERLELYPEGVWFVELEHIQKDDPDPAEAIAIEIATSLELRLMGSTPPIQQVLKHLQYQRALIILDNFESALSGTDFVIDALQKCQSVQFIVTSREALNIRAEWSIDLNGLAFPKGSNDTRQYDAVDLFVARYTQQQRGAISAEETDALRDICRLVEGVPLAIELAAGLTRKLSCATIAKRLETDLTMLSSTMRDVPKRHRSLQIVFDMSWQTLEPDVQRRLARLSYFRGGFTAHAAADIADTNSWHLTTLHEKSLIAYDAIIGRYHLHVVARSYAAKQLPQDDPTPHKHSAYFLSQLAKQTDQLRKQGLSHLQQSLALEFDNIRLAWQTGVQNQASLQLNAALTAFSLMYQLQGMSKEAEITLRDTIQAASLWSADGMRVTIHAGIEQARFQIRQGSFVPAIQTLKRYVVLAREHNERWAEGMAHVLWGEALWRLGETVAAEQTLLNAQEIAQTHNNTLLIGWCYHHLGVVNDIQGRHHIALENFKKACVEWRRINHMQALCGSLNSIGIVLTTQGELEAAQKSVEEALAICNQLNDRHRQSTLLNSLSVIATEQEDFAGAQYYLQLGLELAQANRDLNIQTTIHNNIAKNLMHLGQFEATFKHTQISWNLAKSIGARSNLATASLTIAEAQLKLGKFNLAEAAYLEALTISQQDKLIYTQIVALVSLAELLGSEDLTRAHQYSEQASALVKTSHNPDIRSRVTTIHHHLTRQLSEHQNVKTPIA